MHPEPLMSLLWPGGSTAEASQAYALLDGARDDAIVPGLLRSRLPSTCLYAGKLSPALQAAAPYLVQLAPQSGFFAQLAEQGWPASWGLFALAAPEVTLPVLRKHLRTLLRVRDEDGRLLVFRFYDPRVARIFLPTCSPQQVAEFFGPIHTLVMPGPDPRHAVRLTHQRGVLNVSTVELERQP